MAVTKYQLIAIAHRRKLSRASRGRLKMGGEGGGEESNTSHAEKVLRDRHGVSLRPPRTRQRGTRVFGTVEAARRTSSPSSRRMGHKRTAPRGRGLLLTLSPAVWCSSPRMCPRAEAILFPIAGFAALAGRVRTIPGGGRSSLASRAGSPSFCATINHCLPDLSLISPHQAGSGARLLSTSGHRARMGVRIRIPACCTR